jgi:hypothetical protein
MFVSTGTVRQHLCGTASEKNYLRDVDFLDFKIIEDIGHGLKSEKLASTDILLTLTCDQ